MNLASLSPAITTILTAFDLSDQLVFAEQSADAFTDPAALLSSEAEQADLFFTCGAAQAALAERLKQIDVNIIHHEPCTLNEVYQMIRDLGLVLQKDDEAEEVVLQMQQGFKDVKRKSGLLPDRLPVLILDEHGLVPGLWAADIVHLAGGSYPLQSGNERRNVSDAEKQNAALTVALTDNLAADRVLESAMILEPSPRLVEGCQHLYGYLFEMQH